MDSRNTLPLADCRAGVTKLSNKTRNEWWWWWWWTYAPYTSIDPLTRDSFFSRSACTIFALIRFRYNFKKLKSNSNSNNHP